MDHSQHLRLLTLLPASFAVVAALVACHGSPKEGNNGPPPAGSTRYPEAEIDEKDAQGTGANPWVFGFGGSPPQLSPQAEGAPVGGPEAKEPDNLPGGNSGGGFSKPTSAPPTSAPPEEQSETEAPSTEPPVEPLLRRRFERYLEGEGSDKLLGLWGESGASPEICKIEIYSNGGETPWRTVLLPDEFPEGGELVLCSLPESHPECALTLSGSLYNGNDALLLSCGEVKMDSFGRIGEDPGDAWTSLDGTLRSEGQELVRCGEAVRSDPFSPFELSAEWVEVEMGESLEAARIKCTLLEALGAGGAGGTTL